MKENKENRKSSLTPEQEAKYRKISIVGSVLLALLLVALVASILGVYLSDKKNQAKPYNNPFATIGTTTITRFDEALKNESFNLKYSVTTKGNDKDNEKAEEFEIDVRQINKVYLLFHTDDLDKNLKEKVLKISNKVLETKGNLFLTISIDKDIDGKETKDCLNIIVKFATDYTSNALSLDDIKDEKEIMAVIDVANFKNKNSQNQLVYKKGEQTGTALITQILREKEIIQE